VRFRRKRKRVASADEYLAALARASAQARAFGDAMQRTGMTARQAAKVMDDARKASQRAR